MMSWESLPVSERSARRPFDEIRRALEDGSPRDAGSDRSFITTDPARSDRTGTPEIVYGSGKTPSQVVAALLQLAERSGRAIASRCDGATLAAVERLRDDDWLIEVDAASGVAVVARSTASLPTPVGLVGIIAAGTSDLRIAGEIECILREVGCGSHLIVDVGVAGLHRLVRPLENLVHDGADVLIVVAGMDGALPSVVAGLVHVPVIGVPTSTGYGLGGDGTAALMAMLQSCAPGLTVVNIDNGVEAAIAAARVVHLTHPAAKTIPDR